MLEELDADRGGRVDDRVARWRGVVVGVAEVAVIDEPPEAAVPVEAEGARRAVDLDGHEAVRESNRPGPVGRRRVRERGGLEPAPAEALHGVDRASTRRIDGWSRRTRTVDSGDAVIIEVSASRASSSRTPGRSKGPTLAVRRISPSTSATSTSSIHAFASSRVPWMSPRRVLAVRVSRTSSPGSDVRSLDDLDAVGVVVVAEQHDLDHPAARARGPVGDDVARRAHRRGERLERRRCHAVGDRRRLLEAVEHGVHDLVDAARTDRVVRGVADDLAPREPRNDVGHWSAAHEQRRERLGATLEGALADRGGSLHVDAVGGDPHEHVRAEAAASSPCHSSSPSVGARSRCSWRLEMTKLVVVLDLVGLGDHAAEPRLGGRWSDPFMKRMSPRRNVACVASCSRTRARSGLGVVGQRRPVAVAVEEVLSPHRAAVGGAPPERRRRDVARDPAPDDGVLDAGEGEDLGHLGDVPEHVGEVPDLSDPTEARTGADPELEVADDRLARDQELVHEDVPGSDAEPPGGREPPQPVLVFGADLEVVVDDGQLAVEQEPRVRGVALEEVQQLVHHPHEAHAEGLERLVPLTVPVGVGHDGYAATGHLLNVRRTAPVLGAPDRASCALSPRGASICGSARP